jgi:hypothetical protein
MLVFELHTDAVSHAFLELIAAGMVELFGIPTAEAAGRINRAW